MKTRWLPLIKEWEKTEKIDQSSDPQIAMGASIRTHLIQFRQNLKAAKLMVKRAGDI